MLYRRDDIWRTEDFRSLELWTHWHLNKGFIVCYVTLVTKGKLDKNKLEKVKIVTRFFPQFNLQVVRLLSLLGLEILEDFNSAKCWENKWSFRGNSEYQNDHFKWNHVVSQWWAQISIASRSLKNFQDFNGILTRDLAIPVRCSNQLSYEATDVGSWSLLSSQLPVISNYEWKIYMKYIIYCTAGMKSNETMLSRSDERKFLLRREDVLWVNKLHFQP